MLWINFLHFYQPANADDFLIRQALEKSYWRIIKALEANKSLHLSLNISGCLLERLRDMGEADFLKRLAKLADKGQVELAGSLAYHGFAPLIDIEETAKQIEDQERIIKDILGIDRLKGFFSPEMAYHPNVARLVAESGYEWMILDEIAYNGRLGKVDTSKAYADENSGLKIVLRNRELSDHYAPDLLLDYLNQEEADKNERIVLTATDAELYGLRHEDPTREFERVISHDLAKTMLVSDFISHQGIKEEIRPVISTWSTTEADLYKALPYAMWLNDKSEMHKLLWKLTDFAYRTVEANEGDKNYEWARWHLVRGMASCTFWWASGRDLRDVFGPVAWNPDIVELGINDLIRAVRALYHPSTKNAKIKAEQLAIKSKQVLWHKHWANYWGK